MTNGGGEYHVVRSSADDIAWTLTKVASGNGLAPRAF